MKSAKTTNLLTYLLLIIVLVSGLIAILGYDVSLRVETHRYWATATVAAGEFHTQLTLQAAEGIILIPSTPLP